MLDTKNPAALAAPTGLGFDLRWQAEEFRDNTRLSIDFQVASQVTRYSIQPEDGGAL